MMQETGGNAQAMIENPSKWHSELMNAWDTNLVAKMEEAIAGNIEQLEENKMMGMARLMLQSLIQKKIKDLGATYLTLSLAEIAEKTSLPVDALEGHISTMIQKKVLSAKINKKQGTVDFIDADNEEEGASASLVNPADFETIKTIEAQNLRIVKLLARV